MTGTVVTLVYNLINETWEGTASLCAGLISITLTCDTTPGITNLKDRLSISFSGNCGPGEGPWGGSKNGADSASENPLLITFTAPVTGDLYPCSCCPSSQTSLSFTITE